MCAPCTRRFGSFSAIFSHSAARILQSSEFNHAPASTSLNRSGNVDGGRSHSPPAAVSADAAAKERAADHDDEEVSEHREAFAEHDQREDYGKAHP